MNIDLVVFLVFYKIKTSLIRSLKINNRDIYNKLDIAENI